MPNPNDPFNTMFNSAMKAAANDPIEQYAKGVK